MKLLKKEFTLCMHPTGYIMLLMSAFVLIPGYPYTVSCFYMGLAIYFICLTARENHDASYTLTLPVSREDAVRARILLCCCLELAQMVRTSGIPCETIFCQQDDFIFVTGSGNVTISNLKLDGFGLCMDCRGRCIHLRGTLLPGCPGPARSCFHVR